MGIFDLLFGNKDRPKKSNLHDDFFGDLEYNECKPDPSKSYLLATKYFEPVQDNIAVFITGGLAGPTGQQKDFYRSIEANYATIKEKITPLLEDTFGNWQEGFKIKDFNTEFAIVNLSLPTCTSDPVSWELAFESIHDENHVFTVLMEAFTPTDIQIDG